MGWRSLIEGAYQTRERQTNFRSKPEFCTPATITELEEAERTLDITLPTALRSLFLETNGIKDMMAVEGASWFVNQWTVWSIGEVVSQNLRLRSESIPPGNLSFATAGVDGIYFCFLQNIEGAFGPEVSAWNSFEERVYGLAPSLDDFITGWLNGTIGV